MVSRSPATSPTLAFDGDRPVIRVAETHFAPSSTESPGQPLFRLVEELGRPQVALDFEKVLFLSSIGLTTLLAIHKKLRAAGGHLAVFNVQPHVYEIFSVTRLTTVLDVRAKVSA